MNRPCYRMPVCGDCASINADATRCPEGSVGRLAMACGRFERAVGGKSEGVANRSVKPKAKQWPGVPPKRDARQVAEGRVDGMMADGAARKKKARAHGGGAFSGHGA